MKLVPLKMWSEIQLGREVYFTLKDYKGPQKGIICGTSVRNDSAEFYVDIGITPKVKVSAIRDQVWFPDTSENDSENDIIQARRNDGI